MAIALQTGKKPATGTSVLLVDGESVLGMPVAQCLGREGFQVHLLCDQLRGRTRFSRYIKSIQIESEPPSPEEKVERILASVTKCRADVILPLGVDAAHFCARHRAALGAAVAVPPLSTPESIATFDDKSLTADFCEQHGISHPSIYPFNTQSPLADISFPVLLKPKRGTGAKGIQLVSSADDLRRRIDRGEFPIDSFICQEFIDGFDIDCSVLSVQGEIISAVVQRRPLINGGTRFGVIEFLHHAPTLQLTRDILKAANFSGVAHLDCRIDAHTGETYLVELNPRFWGSLGAAEAAGINFASAMVRLALGEPSGIPAQVRPCLFVDMKNLPRLLPTWIFGRDPLVSRRPFKSDWRDVFTDPAPFIGGALSRW